MRRVFLQKRLMRVLIVIATHLCRMPVLTNDFEMPTGQTFYVNKHSTKRFQYIEMSQLLCILVLCQCV